MPPYDWYNLTDHEYNYSFIFQFETNWDRIEHYHWYKTKWSIGYWCTVVYLFIVAALPPVMSRTKFKFEMKRLLVVWNASMAVFSAIGFLRISNELFRVLHNNGFEHSVCVSSFVSDHVFLFWMKLFMWSKVLEFIDTLLLILRKRPVSFLHWFHHASVNVFVWHGASWLAAPGRWFAWMNFGIHSIMYAYYTYSACSSERPRRIAMMITVSQTVQMLLGVCIGIEVLRVKLACKPCHQSWSNLYLALIIYSVYLGLFCRFFYYSYINGSRKAINIRELKSAESVSTKDDSDYKPELNVKRRNNAGYMFR